ncbi:MAG: S8 family serine peptidase, partial [Candidatus Kariarchaeaceae archaeon]
SESSAYTELGNPYLSADILSPDGIDNQDGYFDMSIGAFGNVYDIFNVTGRFGTGENPMIEGIEEDGLGFGFFHDYFSHGSGVAGSIAAQDIKYQTQYNSSLYSIQGVAPGTKILGTMGLITVSSDIYSVLWSTGYEPNQSFEWVFVNDHIANISSNSWGFSEFANHLGLGDDFVSGFDFYSLFFELLSPPGFVSAEHPGILFVISSGNAGPGYGTGGSPINPSAILVGASTSSWWRENRDPENQWASNQPSDQVIAFSSPGPTTTNYPKVDIVNVGAYDYSVAPSIPYFLSFGDEDLVFAGGNASFQLFSGTSEAAPFTSGVLSVIHETWKDKTQTSITPDEAKIILKSSAVDLGYDLYRQGAGRASIERAVHLILNGSLPNSEELFLLNSTDAYSKAAERISTAFDYWFDGTFKLNESDAIPNGPFIHPNSTISMSDTVVYGGIISPGDAYSANLNINNLATTAIPYTFETFYNSTTNKFSSTKQYNYHFVDDLFDLSELQQSDFFQLTIAFPYEDFLKSRDNNGFLQLLLGQHRDLNGDGIIDDKERVLDTFSSSDGSVTSFFVNSKVINEQTILILRDFMFTEELETNVTPGVNYTLGVRAFKRVVDTQIQVSNSTNFDYEITINPSLNSIPGFYQGFVRFEGANGGYALAPYTYSVPLIINDYTNDGWSEVSGIRNRPFDNGIFGAIDWSWREPSGDWRFYDLEFNGSVSTANTLAIEVEWTFSETVLDVYIYDFEGRVIGKSDINFISGGFYNSTPNAPPTMQRFLVNVTSYRLGDTLSGESLSGNNRYFTIALHATTVSDQAILLDPISVRGSWLTNLISEFEEPQASLTTSDGQFLPDGTPLTFNELGISWTSVTSNPITEFNNTIFPTDYIISRPEFLHEEETIPAKELVPMTEEMEREYKIFLEKGFELSVELSWENYNTDFDLFVVKEGLTVNSGNSIIKSSAGGTNPEKGKGIVPESGMYIIGVDYFGGDRSDQSIILDVIARNVIYKDINSDNSSIMLNLIEMNVTEDDLLIESTSYGWNTKFQYTELIRFDGYAPSLNFSESIPENAITGLVLIGTVYDASTYNFTMKMDGETITALTNVNGSQEISIEASLILGFFENTEFNVSGIDQFGRTLNQIYIVYRTDNTLPIFVEEPGDREVLIDEVFTLDWLIQDISGGSYELKVNGELENSGNWQGGEEVSVTFS